MEGSAPVSGLYSLAGLHAHASRFFLTAYPPRRWSVVTVLLRSGALQQRQQRTPKCLHLLLDLCSGVETRRGEVRPQPRILFREAVVLGSADGHLKLNQRSKRR